jgi:hypothetical protein
LVLLLVFVLFFRHKYAGFTLCRPQGFRRWNGAAIPRLASEARQG